MTVEELEICKDCNSRLWTWTCVYKDTYYSGTCSKHHRKCGDLVVGCEKYECALIESCERAYRLGKDAANSEWFL